MFALRKILVPGGGRFESGTVEAGEELPDTLTHEQLERLVRIGAVGGELPEGIEQPTVAVTVGNPDGSTIDITVTETGEVEDELTPEARVALVKLFMEVSSAEDPAEGERLLREGLGELTAEVLRSLAPELELPAGDDPAPVVDALIDHFKDDEGEEPTVEPEPEPEVQEDPPIDAAKAPKADLEAYVATNTLTVKGTGANGNVKVDDLRKAVAKHQKKS